MSVSGNGMIEVRDAGGQQWFSAARVHFYSDVNVYALLAWPWGEHTEEEDPPAPVVVPRGLPPDLSLLTLHEVAWIPHAQGAKEKEPRCIEPRRAKAKKFKPIGIGLSYVLDTTEWCCLTWLTLAEVKKAADTYPKFHSRRSRSPELEGILGMMGGYAKVRNMDVRLILWFQ